MFKRVLIAEDHEIVSSSVKQALIDLGVEDAKYVSYCDHALSWIRKGVQTGNAYDLLITDLSFDQDESPQEIVDGALLIKAVKEVQRDLKILVFTAEGRPDVIRPLINELAIDAYVRKARRDVQELKAALRAIEKGDTYFPLQMLQKTRTVHSYNFTSYDVTVIGLLAQGIKQKDIPKHLQENNIVPFGLSSLEKKLNQIKSILGFSTNEQLIAYCKDFKII